MHSTSLCDATQSFLINYLDLYLFIFLDFQLGAEIGAVVRALAFYQCGPGSTPTQTCSVVLYSVSRFSKVSKLYGTLSGIIIPSVAQERRGFKSSNFTVILLFVTLKTC